jgi:hypothetical protein
VVTSSRRRFADHWRSMRQTPSERHPCRSSCAGIAAGVRGCLCPDAGDCRERRGNHAHRCVAPRGGATRSSRSTWLRWLPRCLQRVSRAASSSRSRVPRIARLAAPTLRCPCEDGCRACPTIVPTGHARSCCTPARVTVPSEQRSPVVPPSGCRYSTQACGGDADAPVPHPKCSSPGSCSARRSSGSTSRLGCCPWPVRETCGAVESG